MITKEELDKMQKKATRWLIVAIVSLIGAIAFGIADKLTK